MFKKNFGKKKPFAENNCYYGPKNGGLKNLTKEFTICEASLTSSVDFTTSEISPFLVMQRANEIEQ